MYLDPYISLTLIFPAIVPGLASSFTMLNLAMMHFPACSLIPAVSLTLACPAA
ncbi:MAG: hypothetical protein LBG06_06905 [Deltaproteobacteria bacterium]|nr:hypothetical protein [Deltaproteobacteria bacterium]